MNSPPGLQATHFTWVFHDSGWCMDHNDLRPFIIFKDTSPNQCFHHLIFMSFQTGSTLKLATLVVPHGDGAVEAGTGEVLAARRPGHPSHRPVETSSSNLNSSYTWSGPL